MIHKAIFKSKFIFCILLLVFTSAPFANVNAQQPNKTRILFLLDASGSMYAEMGRDTRMDVAKRLLSKMVDSLRNTPNLELALRVYGHQSTKDKQNCRDTKLEIPFGKFKQ